MRLPAALLLACACAAPVLSGCGQTHWRTTTVTASGEPVPPPLPNLRSTITVTTPSSTVDAAKTFVMIGDSMAVVTAIDLPNALPEMNVVTDAQGGRKTELGLAALRARTEPADVLGIGLFTNDDPADVDDFEAAVRETVDGGSAPCVIWATIVRGDDDFSAVNDKLADLEQEYAGQLQVVDWAAMVEADPALLADDTVHPTPKGALERARAYAEAATRCPS